MTIDDILLLGLPEKENDERGDGFSNLISDF